MHANADSDRVWMISKMTNTEESRTKLAQQELLVERLRTSWRDIEDETMKLTWVYKEPTARNRGLLLEIKKDLHMWNQEQIFSVLRKVLVDA